MYKRFGDLGYKITKNHVKFVEFKTAESDAVCKIMTFKMGCFSMDSSSPKEIDVRSVYSPSNKLRSLENNYIKSFMTSFVKDLDENDALIDIS